MDSTTKTLKEFKSITFTQLHTTNMEMNFSESACECCICFLESVLGKTEEAHIQQTRLYDNQACTLAKLMQ